MPVPIIKSLVVCSEAILEPFGSHTLRGVGSVFGAKSYPVEFPIVLYAHVTELYQPAVFHIEVVDAATERAGLFLQLPPLSSDSPTGVVNDVMHLKGFYIPKAGDYILRVLYEGVSLANVRLTFFTMTSSDEQQAPEN